MATNMKVKGEVTKVERKSGYTDDYLEVTIKANKANLVIEVPLYKSKSYRMGRTVEVNINAK